MVEKTLWRKSLQPKRMLIGFVIIKLVMGLQNFIYKKPTFAAIKYREFHLGKP